jgi:hypothetical protein
MHTTKWPAPRGNRPSDNVQAGERDKSEDTKSPQIFQQVGTVASALLARLADRHNLTADRARLIAEAADLKGAAE